MDTENIGTTEAKALADDVLPAIPTSGDIVFMAGPQHEIEMLRLTHTGDIYVKGVLAETDKSVVEALRAFLKAAGYG